MVAVMVGCRRGSEGRGVLKMPGCQTGDMSASGGCAIAAGSRWVSSAVGVFGTRVELEDEVMCSSRCFGESSDVHETLSVLSNRGTILFFLQARGKAEASGLLA